MHLFSSFSKVRDTSSDKVLLLPLTRAPKTRISRRLFVDDNRQRFLQHTHCITEFLCECLRGVMSVCVRVDVCVGLLVAGVMVSFHPPTKWACCTAALLDPIILDANATHTHLDFVTFLFV